MGAGSLGRRPPRRHRLARGPRAGLWRGGRLLGRGADGPAAGPDRRGGPTGAGSPAAGIRTDRAHPRRGGTTLDRAAPGGIADPGRGRRLRPRRAVRGLAALLRARLRADSGGDDLRGSAVGRPGTARLRGIPGDLVPHQADLPPRPLAPGAARRPADLGLRGRKLHGDHARATPRRRDAGAARRPGDRPRTAAGGSHPPQRGRRPAVRGRGGPDAHGSCCGAAPSHGTRSHTGRRERCRTRSTA